MNPWFQTLTELPPWQSAALKMTALLAAAWLVHFALVRANPRWRVLLWRGVLVGLFFLPLAEWIGPKLEVPIAQPPPLAEAVPLAAPPTTVAPPEPPPAVQDYPPAARTLPDSEPAAPPFSIREWIAAHSLQIALTLWSCVVFVLSVLWFLSATRLKRFLQETDPAPQSLCELLEKVQHDLGCRKKVRLRLTPENISPFLAGHRRPTIVIPQRMTEPPHARDLPSVLAHELAHAKSGDVFWTQALRAASILLWFHPLLWRMKSAHAAACEQVCDAVAATYTGDASAYSQTLARTALDLLVDSPAATGLPMIRTAEITRRLRNLRRGMQWRALSGRWVVPISCFCSAIVFLVGSAEFVMGNKGTDPGTPLPEIFVDSNVSEPLIEVPGFRLRLLGVFDLEARIWKPNGSPLDLNSLPDEAQKRIRVKAFSGTMGSMRRKGEDFARGLLYEIEVLGDGKAEHWLRSKENSLRFRDDIPFYNHFPSSKTTRILTQPLQGRSEDLVEKNLDVSVEFLFSPFMDQSVEIGIDSSTQSFAFWETEFKAAIQNLPEKSLDGLSASVRHDNAPKVVMKFIRGEPFPGYDWRVFLKNGEWQRASEVKKGKGRYEWAWNPHFGKDSIDKIVYSGLNVQPITWRNVALHPWSASKEAGIDERRNYGRVEGQVWIGDRVATDSRIKYLRIIPGTYPVGHRAIPTDSDGRFQLENLPPGEYNFARYFNWTIQSEEDSMQMGAGTHGVLVDVEPGKTTKIKIGGEGRQVVGRLVPGPNNDGETVALTAFRKRYFTIKDADPDYARLLLDVKSDGSFEIPDVLPSTYILTLDARVNTDEPRYRELEAIPTQFEIPAATPREEKVPYDLGEIRIQLEQVETRAGLRSSPRLQFRLVAEDAASASAEVFPLRNPDERDGESLPLEPEILLTENDIQSVSVQPSHSTDTYLIQGSFTEEAKIHFAVVTGNNIKRKLAMVFDGEIVTAPVIRDRIAGGQFVIEGSFSKSEAEEIAEAIQAANPDTDQGSEEESDDREPVREPDTDSEFGLARVKVLDADGNPIEGAEVTPVAVGHKESGGSSNWEEEYGDDGPFMTDANGEVVIAYPREIEQLGEIVRLKLMVNHPDYCIVFEHNHLLNEPSPAIFLDQGGTLTVSGYIDDEKDTVEIYPELPLLVSSLTTTQIHWERLGDGRMRMNQLPEGQHTLRLVHFPTEGQTYFSEPVTFKAEKEEEYEFHLSLKPGIRLEGTLDTEVPRPVRKGMVVARVREEKPTGNFQGQQWSFLAWHTWREIRDDGSFLFESLPAGDLELISVCEGFVSTSPDRRADRVPETYGHGSPQIFSISEPTEEVAVDMEPTATCDIRVVNVTGQPIEGIEVSFAPSIWWNFWGADPFGAPAYRQEEVFKGGERINFNSWDNRRTRTLENDYTGVSNASGEITIQEIPSFSTLYLVKRGEYELVDGQNPNPVLGFGTTELRPGETTEVTIRLRKTSEQPEDVQEINKALGVNGTPVEQEIAAEKRCLESAIHGRLDEIRILLQRERVSIDVSNASGQTPLILAARHGHKEIVEFLLEQGADVNASDNEGKNAWYHAAFNHHDSVAKILVQHGATWQSIERRPQPEPLDVIDPKLKRSY